MPAWLNQYVPLVKTKPELIMIGQEDSKLSASDSLRLKEKIEHFGGKVSCELGSGSGAHLVGLAKRDPQTLYIGFELRFKRVFRTAEKAQQAQVNNLLVLQANARSLELIFEQQSLNSIYINFPDPWSKRRWHKHRLIQPVFLDLAAKLLKPNGFIAHKSDHQEYFEAALKLFQDHQNFHVLELTYNLHQSDFINNNIITEFEQLFCSKNMPIHYLKALRC